MVMFVLVFSTLVAVYAFWIRPILQSRPAFRDLYDKEENFFAALREKLKGIKQKLSSAIVIMASAAVTATTSSLRSSTAWMLARLRPRCHHGRGP